MGGCTRVARAKAYGFFSRLACDRIHWSHCRRLVRTRMAGSARHGRTFLSLLARWTHLDETVVSKLTRGKKDAVESVSNINFDYRRTEWLRNSVLAEVLLKI